MHTVKGVILFTCSAVPRLYPLSSGRKESRGGGGPLSSQDSLRLYFAILRPLPPIHWPQAPGQGLPPLGPRFPT